MTQARITSNTATPLLAAAKAAGANLAPLMRVFAARLKNDLLRNFREGGWFPALWRPSKRVEREGGQTLIITSTLRNSNHTASGADWAGVGTDNKYARIHQFGGTVPLKARVNAHQVDGKFMSRKDAKKTTRRSEAIENAAALRISITGARIITIPARPFLPMSPEGRLAPETDSFLSTTTLGWLLKQKLNLPA